MIATHEKKHHAEKEEDPNARKTGIKEYDALKASVVQLVGANSDGRKLYLVVEVFDGEHTNRFEPEFDLDTSSEEITDYLISIIEKDPRVKPEITGLLQKKIFWDKAEEAWFTQAGNEKPQKIEHRAKKDDHKHVT